MFDMNELVHSVKYPFSSSTKEIVRWLKFDLNSLDPTVLERAKQRAIGGIEGSTIEPNFKSKQKEILLKELLSHPVAKIIVALTRDKFLIERYAAAEANAMRKFLHYEKGDVISAIAEDLEIAVKNDSVSFIDYVSLVPARDEFRLVNSQLGNGRVHLGRERLVEMLANRLKEKLVRDMGTTLDVPEVYTTYANELKAEVKRERAFSTERGELGPVEAGHFPPCIKLLMQEAQSGSKMQHQPRFVLSTFLINTNMPLEQIVNVFRSTPNFNENKTRYFVEYSAGKRGSNVQYTAPGCEKMGFYGLCRDKDELCERIKHPLSYYARKKGVRRRQPPKK